MSCEMFVISRFLYSIVVSSYIVFSVVCLSVCLRLATYLDSLPWEATITNQTIYLLTTVFSILLFNFRQVLELDSFSFENSTLHILDHLLLLFAKSVVPELHLVNLLTHSNDFCLSDSWVK